MTRHKHVKANNRSKGVPEGIVPLLLYIRADVYGSKSEGESKSPALEVQVVCECAESRLRQYETQ